MLSLFRHVALIGKYQTTGTSAAGASSRKSLDEIAHYLMDQSCEVVIEAEPLGNTESPGPLRFCFRVRDSGKGLSEADFAHLFEPFYTTKASGAGLGLGLVICRDIAAEFQGALQAHNVPEGGACFTLTVPLWQASMHPKTPVTP